jgi:TP901 family phage tail tape measure protein
VITIYKLDLVFGAQTDKSELKKVDSELNALYKKYNGKKIDFGLNTKKSSDAVKKTTANVKKLNTSLKTTATQTKNVSGRMKEAVLSTVQWTVAVGGLYSAINKVKDSFTFTAEIDKSLTEIAMVTGKTREEVQGLKDEYLELGEAIKVSTTELANSAVALYRQGLSAQEVNNRLGEIAKTAKVAGLSISEVTTFVTSGMNAMELSATRFNDVLLKVGAVAATDYAKLATSLQASAKSFDLAGFSLEKAAGVIAQVQEVTQQSAESIGSSMKTILARFNKLTAEGKDNTVVLNDIDKALQSIGMTLQDDAGQFKDTAVVLDELGSVWDTLDKNTQNYLSTTIAGVRQIERFSVLMTGYNRALEITDEAMQAAGTTAEQYAKFQESLEGKTNALANAWERLYGAMVNEDFMGNFLDLAKDVVEGLISIETNFGLINTTLAITIPLLALFKGELIAAKATGFIGFIIDLVFWLKNAESGAMATVLGITSLNIAMMGIVGVIGLVVGSVVILEAHQRQLREEIAKTSDELDISIQKWDELTEAELRNARVKAKLAIDEITPKLEALNAQLELSTKIVDDNTKVIEKNNQLYLDGVISKEEYEDATRIASIQVENHGKVVANTRAELELYYKSQDVVNGSIELLNQRITEGNDLQDYWTDRLEKTSEASDKVNSSMSRAVPLFTKVQDKIKEITEDYEFMSEAGKANARAFIQAEIDKSKKLKESVLERIDLYQAEFDTMLKLIMLGEDTLTAGQLNRFTELGKGIGALKQRVEEITISTNKLEDTFESVTKVTEETTKALKDLSSQIESENVKAVEKYRDTIVESLDEEKELIERNKEAWERDFEDRKTVSDRYYEDLLDSHDAETDSLKEKREIEEEIADIQKTQLELSKLQEKLAAINKQRNVRVLTASGWQWVADPSEIEKVNEEIAKVEETLAEQQQEKLESKQDRSREATRKHYEEEKLIIDRAFEDEKTLVERGYEDQFNTIDYWLDEIKDEESTNYTDRLTNLAAFVADYNTEMAKMGSDSRVGTPTTPTIQDPGGTPVSKKDETIQQMKLNSAQWGAASASEKKRLADENLKLGGGIGWSRNNAGEWIDESGKKAYANGGLMDYTGDATIHGTKSRPELALNNQQSAGLFNFIKGLGNFNPSMMSDKTPVSSGGKSITIQQLNLPGVRDGYDLIDQLDRVASTGGGN